MSAIVYTIDLNENWWANSFFMWQKLEFRFSLKPSWSKWHTMCEKSFYGGSRINILVTHQHT